MRGCCDPDAFLWIDVVGSNVFLIFKENVDTTWESTIVECRYYIICIHLCKYAYIGYTRQYRGNIGVLKKGSTAIALSSKYQRVPIEISSNTLYILDCSQRSFRVIF